MIKKRHKLRLRKQVIMCIPVALFILVILTFLLINRESVFLKRSTGTAVAAPATSAIQIDDIVPLSEREIFVNLDSTTKQRQKDNTVIYYAQKFKLDVDKTLEIARKLTNNFEDADFNKNFVIATKAYKNKIGPFDSFEAGVVFFVRDLYRYPERYGSSVDEIRTSEVASTERTIINKVIYIDGLTIYQYIGKICDLFGVDKELALAISYQETGVLTSNLFVNGNNLGGQKGVGGWMRYTTLEAGIIGFVLSIRNIIQTYNVDMTSDNAIHLLSGPYVHGTSTMTDEHWASKVTYFKNKIHEQDLFS